MKTIFRIFFRDVRRLLRNPIALIIVAGVLVLPSLYAWYCIAANWDPYNNTVGIRVAVSNNDRGAVSEVAGRLDVGAQVVSSLEENDDLGWEFVSEQQARTGVEAGEYYAAIIIPSNFSADFASVFTGDGTREKPQLEYYVNEKKNAVANKVTDTGASTIEEQINATFVSTVGETLADTAKKFAGEASGAMSEAGDGIAKDVDDARATIERVRASLDTMGCTIDSVRAAVDCSRQTLENIRGQLPEVSQALVNGGVSLQSARQSSSSFMGSVSGTIGNSTTLLGGASAQANATIGETSGRILQMQGEVDGLLTDATRIMKENQALVDELEGLKADLPDQAQEIEKITSQLKSQNAQHEQTIASLQRTSDGVKRTALDAVNASSSVTGATQTGLSAISEAQRNISTDVTYNLSSSLDSFASASGQLAGVVASLDPAIGQTEGLLDQMASTLDQTKETAASVCAALGATEQSLATTVTDLRALNDSASLQDLASIWGVNPDSVAEFMASPVKLETEVVYPVENYGSGVAPFYTNLALWVGGFILVAILKLEVDPERIGRFSPTQGYLGRWLLFVTFALIQAAIVCVGDLVIGVQCLNPVAFVAAGMFTSFVYVNLIYALASTFKHIGKALAVVLLIMQIPGSSGMYPIEMMPAAFQAVHPFLPFTYGITAMREAMAGMYGMHFFESLGYLALFLPVALLIGLAARPYLLNLNLLFDKKLAETGVMVSEEHHLSQERFRLRTVVRALLDTEAYRTRLVGRVERFERNYGRLRRTGLVLMVALPVLLLVVMSTVASLVSVDIDTKIVLLGLWILALVAVDFYLILIEYMHENLAYQLGLSSLDGSDLAEHVRSHLTFGVAGGAEKAVAPEGEPSPEEGRQP